MRAAVETGADGIDVLFGTSSYLRQFSHGKDIAYIIDSAQEVIEFVKGAPGALQRRTASAAT